MTIQNLESLVVEGKQAIQAKFDYDVQVTQNIEDPEWDSFLAKTPDGHHVQTGLWAQIKSTLGWQMVRIKFKNKEILVAGAQILFRTIPVFGRVGYVSKGPLLASDDPNLVENVVCELQRVASEYRIQYLIVQPPGNGSILTQIFSSRGFLPSSTEIAPRATLLLDLSKDEETLLSEMTAKTRYNVRLGGRKGIKVREGTERDLDNYYKVLVATGRRQNFSPYPKEYFTKMWRVLHPPGYIRLSVAEYDDQFVSAQLAVPFGDTVINKLSVWSGECGNRRPNEALQWETIQWAKRQGFRYYDFEGIKPSVIEAIQNNDPLPASLKQSVTSYKLGFGGQATLFSEANVYLYNPIYRWAYREIFPKMQDLKVLKKMRKSLRTD